MATPCARMQRVNLSMSWSDWAMVSLGGPAAPPWCPPRLATCGPAADEEQAAASRAAAKRAAVTPMTAPRGQARPAGRGTAVPPEDDLWRFIVGLQSFALEMPSSRRFTGRGVTRAEHDPPLSAAVRPRLRAGAQARPCPGGRQGGGRVMRM